MNKALTVALKKSEVAKIMARVAKCDRRIEHGIIGVTGQEPEVDRKQRLLVRVSELMTEITTLEKE